MDFLDPLFGDIRLTVGHRSAGEDRRTGSVEARVIAKDNKFVIYIFSTYDLLAYV